THMCVLEILGIGKVELAVEIRTVQRRRTDVEDDVHALADRDDVTFPRKRPAGPAGGIGPKPAFDYRRTLTLRFGVLVRRGVLLRLRDGACRETGRNEH